jgi:hypothetical protein
LPALVDDGVVVTQGDGVSTITWNPAAGSTSSGVLRGLVSQLPVGPGGGDELCLQDGLQSGFTTDGQTPPVGEIYWYLIRGVNACGAGSYGSAVQSGQPTTRASSTCP